jgi:hypothetical protein
MSYVFSVSIRLILDRDRGTADAVGGAAVHVRTSTIRRTTEEKCATRERLNYTHGRACSTMYTSCV